MLPLDTKDNSIVNLLGYKIKVFVNVTRVSSEKLTSKMGRKGSLAVAVWFRALRPGWLHRGMVGSPEHAH